MTIPRFFFTSLTLSFLFYLISFVFYPFISEYFFPLVRSAGYLLLHRIFFAESNFFFFMFVLDIIDYRGMNIPAAAKSHTLTILEGERKIHF